MTERCETCRYWTEGVILDEHDHFKCERGRPNWPWVARTDWCDEYEAKEE